MADNDTIAKFLLNSDSQPESDLLERGRFIQQVETLIVNYPGPEPLVIGIYGSWGEGKTYVLNELETRLRKQEDDAKDIITVAFNPWIISDPTLLLEEFFHTLQDAIGSELESFDLKPYAKRILGSALGLWKEVASSSTIPALDAAFGTTEEVANYFMKGPTLKKLKDDIEGKLVSNNKRVVVLIDDLDRLDDDEVFLITQLVKRVAGFKKFIYVLACDDEIVSKALSKRYADNGDTGARFLGKIIQAPFRLPEIPESVLVDVLKHELKKVSDKIVSTFETINEVAVNQELEMICSHSVHTLRDVKRLCNGLSLSFHIRSPKTNSLDFLAIETIRIFHPKLYRKIRESRELYARGEPSLIFNADHPEPETIKQRWNELISHVRDQASASKEALFTHLKRMFPVFKRQQPKHPYAIGSYDCFDAYFTYLE